MNRKSEFVDYMKGMSILGVVLYHLLSLYLNVPDIIKTASGFGGAGTHVFFICSGFGLTVSYMYKPLKYMDFIKVRLKQIYVPYIAIIILSFFIPYMYVGEDRIPALLSHIFLYKMFIPRYVYSFGNQFWYISTLFQFYFIYPMIMKLKEKYGTLKFLSASCIISLLWMIFTAAAGLYEERVWSSFFLQYLWEFSFGIFFAELYRKQGKIFGEDSGFIPKFLVTITAFFLYAVMSLKGGILKNFNDIFSVLAFGGTGYLLYYIPIFRKLCKKINTFRYEWYLVHILVFTSCFTFLPDILGSYITGIAALFLSILCAIGYHKLLNPIQNPHTQF